MMNNLTNKPEAELRELLQQSRQMLTSLAERFADRPDMQNAIRRLMRPDDMLETFSELAVKEPFECKASGVFTVFVFDFLYGGLPATSNRSQ